MPADNETANPVTLTPTRPPLVVDAPNLLSLRTLMWVGLALALVLGFAVLATHQRAPMPLPPAAAGR
jgi:hypothetical protein